MKITNRSQSKTRQVIAFIAIAGFIFSSCSSQSDSDKSQKTAAQALAQKEANSASVDNYFLNLDSWDRISPSKADEKKVSKTTSTDLPAVASNDPLQQKPAQTCTVQEVDLTKTPEKIVMQNPAAGILYPGALIQGEGYLQGPGGLRELPIRQRAPMAIVLDLANAKNSAMIENINYASYQEAYAKLVQDVMAHGAQIPANIVFDQIDSYKSEQAALDLGFSAKYLGNSLSGNSEVSLDSSEHTFMAVFEQRAFTISAVAPESPSGFFSADFSDKDLASQEALGNIGPKNPPVYVSSVSYGRILMFTITSKASKADLQMALKGSYTDYVSTSVDASAKAKYQKIMNEATVRVISVGGATQQVEELIKSGNIKDYFSGAPSIDSYVPISYTFRNIRDNSVAKVSETTRYSNVECTAKEVKAWKARISVDGLNVKHGFSAYYSAFVYGQIKLDNKVVWNHAKSTDYLKMEKNKAFAFGADKGVIEVVLPVAKDKIRNIPFSANLRENLAPLENWWKTGAIQYLVGTFPLAQLTEDRIGYSLDGRVLEDGTYTIQSQNVDVLYSVKRLEPIYE